MTALLAHPTSALAYLTSALAYLTSAATPSVPPALVLAPACPSPREGLRRLLSRLDATTLSELEAVALLDRTDTKYLLTTSQLGAALATLGEHYLVLEVDGVRLHRYQTLYFDTLDFSLFRSHRAGKAVRHKVRSRAYLDSGLTFLEVKTKNNKGRTVKHRLRTPRLVADLQEEGAAFVAAHAAVDPGALRPVLWNDFHRITLVGRRHAERLTVDVGLTFEADQRRTAALPGIVVAELKQRGVDRSSPFVRHMRATHVPQAGMSKYCVGVSLLHDGVRHNTFMPTLRALRRLARETACPMLDTLAWSAPGADQ